ncbi:hypothetical protein Sjap_020450 [Stephania japonica]|uniref:Uncharacterized protein n=1 Tax=Stephania japonica TaxID=461633 RepID=A0AAP0F210_9MAGN
MLIEALLHQISLPSLALSQIFSIRRCNGARPSPRTLRCLPDLRLSRLLSGGRRAFRDLNRRKVVFGSLFRWCSGGERLEICDEQYFEGEKQVRFSLAEAFSVPHQTLHRTFPLRAPGYGRLCVGASWVYADHLEVQGQPGRGVFTAVHGGKPEILVLAGVRGSSAITSNLPTPRPAVDRLYAQYSRVFHYRSSMDGRSTIPSETRQAGIVIRSPQATVSLEDRLTDPEVRMTKYSNITGPGRRNFRNGCITHD